MSDALIPLAEAWFPIFAIHMLEVSVFVLVVWVVDRFSTLSTSVRYSLWLCALAKMFVPPFYTLHLPEFLTTHSPVTPPLVSNFVDADVLIVPAALQSDVASPEIFPVSVLFFVLWSFSVAGLLGLTLWRNRTFQRALGIANPVYLSRELDDLTRGSNLKVYSKAKLKSPLLVGVVKPRLYLPVSWQTWTPTQLRGVIAHELAHYHNRDLWTLSLQVVVTILFGVNPLIWLVNSRLAHLRELRCDEVALRKSGISPVEYGKLLYAFLDAKAHPGLPALGFNEKDTPLKKRFEHVLSYKGDNMKHSKWQFVAPILIALAIIPFSVRETYSQSQSGMLSKKIQESPQTEKRVAQGMNFSRKAGATKLNLLRVTGPQYPIDLATQGVEGDVEMELVVGVNGHVSEVRLVGGDSRFEAAAKAALLKTRFEPPNGGLSVTLRQKVIFRLKDEKGMVIELPNNFWDSSDMGEMVVWARTEKKSASNIDLKIKPTKQIPPMYPEDVRLKGGEGYVVMNVKIGSDGRVRDVYFVEGDVRFALAAKTALEQFRYTPFTHAETVDMKQIMVFKLSGENWPVYEPDVNMKEKSDFGPMITMARAPERPTPKAEPKKENSRESGEGGKQDELIKDASEVDVKPHPIKIETPKYPEEARAQKLTGTVHLSCVVNTDGTVSDIQIERGDEIFRQPSIEAALKMRFRPAEHQGKVVPVRLKMPFSFALKGAPESDNGDDVGLKNSFKPDTAQLWLNSQGEILIDRSKVVSVGDLASELERLKDVRGLKMVVIKPDPETPETSMKNVLRIAENTGLRIKVESDIMQFFQVSEKPELIYQVPPEYPEIARKAGLMGRVFLKFMVNTDGTVSNVMVLRGKQIFHQAAIDAVQQFKFKPAQNEGKPVAVWMTQPVNFRLSKSEMEYQDKG